MSDGSNFRRCSSCGKHFKSRAACDMHISDKHNGKARRVPVKGRYHPEYEPSMAEQMIDAQIDRACGLNVPDYLVGMMK